MTVYRPTFSVVIEDPELGRYALEPRSSDEIINRMDLRKVLSQEERNVLKELLGSEFDRKYSHHIAFQLWSLYEQASTPKMAEPILKLLERIEPDQAYKVLPLIPTLIEGRRDPDHMPSQFAQKHLPGKVNIERLVFNSKCGYKALWFWLESQHIEKSPAFTAVMDRLNYSRLGFMLREIKLRMKLIQRLCRLERFKFKNPLVPWLFSEVSAHKMEAPSYELGNITSKRKAQDSLAKRNKLLRIFKKNATSSDIKELELEIASLRETNYREYLFYFRYVLEARGLIEAMRDEKFNTEYWKPWYEYYKHCSSEIEKLDLEYPRKNPGPDPTKKKKYTKY